MANAATPDAHGWLRPALAVVGAITAARIALLWFNRMDLFVDEAQYWLWGQDLAFGYYSKPPLIGWTIRAMTDLAGSDAAFWVRLPAPLLHAATGLILGAIAAHGAGRRAAVLVAAGYVTLPMVSLASILMSTDTVMLPFLALALWAYIRMLDAPTSMGLAALCGMALGIAFMGKYAAVYYILCAGLAAIMLRNARPRLAQVAMILLAFAIVISPNVIWNLQNGLTTLEHTMDNADWVRDPGQRAGLDVASLGAFLASQFAVFGPVLFGGLIWMTLRAGRQDAARRRLMLFTLPIIAVVCIQALLSGAYANWAAAAYAAGTVAVVPWLTRPWLRLSFVVNGAIALALPILGVFADSLTYDGRLIAERHVGQAALSQDVIALARTEGLDTVVSGNRDLLADLFYTGRDSGLIFYAIPPKGRAPHHYALNFPMPAGQAGDVLLVTRQASPPACMPDAAPIARITAERGTYRNRTWTAFRLPATCWDG